MASADPSLRSPERLAAAAAVALSILLAHHPMILSGFERIHGDLGDARLQNFTLEHSFRALTGAASYWNPPFFHPEPNYTVRTDLLLTSAPPYWGLRAVGMSSERAFQGWFLAVTAFNALAMFGLLSRGLRVSPWVATVGAVLFAAGAPRVARLHHPQLLVHGFAALTLWALWEAFRTETTPARRRAWIALAFAAVVAQVYGSYYLGFFEVLSLVVAGGLALGWYQHPLWALVRPRAGFILGCAGCAALAAAPFVVHAARAVAEQGPREYAAVLHAYPSSVVRHARNSVLYAGLSDAGAFSKAPVPLPHEQPFGIGVLTPVMAVVGVVLARKRPGVLLMAIAILVPLLLATRFPLIGSGWKHVYAWFPGAKGPTGAVRAGMQLLLLVPVGVVFALEATRRRWGLGVTAGLAALLVAEQLHRAGTTYGADEALTRRGELAARVGAHCEAFYVPPCGTYEPVVYQVDAMWAALTSGTPTVNGYTGAQPSYWRGRDPCSADALAGWVTSQGLDDRAVCEVAPRH